MNRDWYRQTVRSIRWSPSKRAEIEARLREADYESESHPQPFEDWEHEISDPNEAYRQQRWEMIKSEEYDMKHRRMTRIMTIGILAAMLATGGAIGAAVAYAKKHPQTLNITWKNGITLNLTNQEFEEPFGMKYSANANYTSTDQIITETETGWFYHKGLYDGTPSDDDLRWWGDSTTTLFYTDKESGQTVPVCARPNCLHDGNEYCPATTYTYAHSYLTYYDGYLYAVTTKYLHPENRYSNHVAARDTSNGPDVCRQVLIRYSPDGTDITELADFGNGIGAAKCIVHRGYVWCIVQRQEYGEEVENPITHDVSRFESGGWQLWGYELATGKSAILYDAMGDPTIAHVNATPTEFMAYGDYLYFLRNGDDWSGAQGLCRLSLLTGEVTNGEEEVLITGWRYVCMSPTHAIRYKDIKADENVFDSETITGYYLLDLESREETFIGDSQKFAEDASTDDMQFDSVTVNFMNREYLFASDMDGSGRIGNATPHEILFIMDYDGNLLRTVDTGFTKASEQYVTKDDDGGSIYHGYVEGIHILAVTDDTVYIAHSVNGTTDELQKRGKERISDVLYCTIDSLMNDETPDWQRAYSIEQEVRGNAQ